MVSPLLANIVLHYVLDEWFAKEVRPRLKGEAFLIRYADDFVIGVAREDDARRIMEVLPKRMSKYGLTVHPEKTRVVRFHPADAADSEPADQNSTGPRTFEFLGFTHYWGRSLKGGWVVKRKTAKSRLKRAIHSLSDWCRQHLHQPIAVQHQTLKQKLQGHYAYYGITGNFPSLQEFLEEARKIWRNYSLRCGFPDVHVPLPFDAHFFLSHLAADTLGVLNHPLADRHLLLDHRPLLHKDLLLPYRDADLLAGPDVGVGDGRAVRGMPLDDDLLPLHRDFDRAVLGDHLFADPDLAHLHELLVDLELLLAELNPRALAGPGGRGTRVCPGGARCPVPWWCPAGRRCTSPGPRDGEGWSRPR